MAGRTRRPLSLTPAFWDASALVPLCVRQSITPLVLALYRDHNVVVWWGTPVEIASALARLVRTGQIGTADFAKARRLSQELAESWSAVGPSETVRIKAVQLVGRYDLRAADSLQLAAALEWCEDAPHGRILLTADQKLAEAAILAGFNVRQL